MPKDSYALIGVLFKDLPKELLVVLLYSLLMTVSSNKTSGSNALA